MTFNDNSFFNRIKHKIYSLVENPKIDLPPPTEIQPLKDTGALLKPLQINEAIEDNILDLDPYPIYSVPTGPPVPARWMKENVIPLCYGGFITTCLVTGLILSNTISNAIDTPGAKGDQGIVGIQGESGTNGKNGLQGVEGVAGLDGEQGETGIPGSNGIQGEVGAIGLTGAAGLNGAKGDAGVAGLNGVNGSAGANGSTGATGNNGTNGANGSNGADGTSSLFLKTKTTDTAILRAGSTVLQLSLPAGAYLLVWTGLVLNGNFGEEFVNCGIQNATLGDPRAIRLAAFQRGYMALQTSLILTEAGNASVFCNTNNSDLGVIMHQTFSAQKVSLVTVQ
jgi:hypothetical protein